MKRLNPALDHIFRSGMLICMILFVSNFSLAQLNYPDFSNNPGGLTFIGDAGFQTGNIRLISGLFGGGRGAVWTTTAQPVRNGFICMFTFRISNPVVFDGVPPEYVPQGGADGFAFVIQSPGTGAIGNGGGQIGYASDTDGNPLGIPNSLAIEFDTYKNEFLNDPDANHVSVHASTSIISVANENVSSIARIDSAGLGINLKDGIDHNVRIEYDSTRMKIFIDDLASAKLDFPVDLNSILSSAELATIGFTAGSAAEAENHDISKWSFSPNFTSQQYLGTAVDADTDGTSSFVMTEYHPGADPATNYNLNPQVDTSVLPDRATEIWAKYYFPNNLVGGPFPLVVLLHGNHGTCGIGTDPRVDNNAQYTTNGVCPAGYTVSPSHKGYDYLANKLTSWGYIVVSINANLGITSGSNYLHNPNMFPEYPADPNLIWARGRLVLRHLQKMSEWNQGVTQFTTSATLGAMRNDITGWVGEKVTIGSVPVTIRSLGRMYSAGNNQTHTVKIVKATDNTTVASVSVPMSNGIHRQFEYTDLSVPATLIPFTTYYIVSQETSGGDMWGDSEVV